MKIGKTQTNQKRKIEITQTKRISMGEIKTLLVWERYLWVG